MIYVDRVEKGIKRKEEILKNEKKIIIKYEKIKRNG